VRSRLKSITRMMAPAVASFMALLLVAAPAPAQDWPSRPVKIVVAFGPGGSADQFGRLLAAELAPAFKQQFYVENRPGNSGSIGSTAVARAEPDGYTLLIGGSGPHITGPAINPNIGYDPLKDFTHIAMIGGDTYVLVANPALGVKNIDELVKLARSRKDAITSSSTGPGSLGQLILEEFKRDAGIDILHVPAPNNGVIDVLGNHISMTITTILTVGEQIKAEKMVPLAVTSLKRNPVFTDIPTFAEQGYPNVRGDTWFWLAGPKNLPASIVEILNREVRRILATPKMREYFAQRALLSMDVDVADVNKFIAGEVAYWGPLANQVGLSVQ
jgi:tripartite-type tricarboxylate transporter receptor subunit TctC